jgi:ribosomal protein S6--L-glutamate ligase
MSQNERVTIGWKESIDLPDWGIHHITAKADTGARRSAIDVKHILELPGNRVQFDIVLNRKNRDFIQTVVSPIAHQTHVRSSNGEQHERYFVTTTIKIGSIIKTIELSLVDRKNMTCRMLLGRKALDDHFLIDSSQTHLSRPNRKLKVAESGNINSHPRSKKV